LLVDCPANRVQFYLKKALADSKKKSGRRKKFKVKRAKQQPRKHIEKCPIQRRIDATILNGVA
jgi:hypothetical protein